MFVQITGGYSEPNGDGGVCEFVPGHMYHALLS